MKLPIYQVDAFTSKLFSGNPAAVVPLTEELPEQVMQSIANENNLSETAFIDISTEPFNIRWFTPTTEVNLCGHATLASAKILFEKHLDEHIDQITFDSKSGELTAVKKDGLIFLDFPTDHLKKVKDKGFILDLLGFEPQFLFKGRDDYLAIFETEKIIMELIPNFIEISKIDSRGLIASAPGYSVDFVSRCFFPQTGVNEDPVTGSAHTTMIPYWSKTLSKNTLLAHQLSKRGGVLHCENNGERVKIGGDSLIYFIGEISL